MGREDASALQAASGLQIRLMFIRIASEPALRADFRDTSPQRDQPFAVQIQVA